MHPADIVGVYSRPVLRRRILRGLQSAFQWTGAAAAYVRALDVHGAVILMYHSVTQPGHERWILPANRIRPEVFDAQMRFLSRYRNVVTLDELTSAIDRRENLEAGSVVITFDDGYRDTFTTAAPILAHYKLPAIAFLPTECLNRTENMWSDRLYGIFANRTHDSFTTPSGTYDLANAHVRRKAFESLHELLLADRAASRDEVLRFVERQLTPKPLAPRLTLTWDEVRQMTSRYPLLSVGLHSANHIDLTSCSIETLHREVRQCVEDLERETGLRAKHFSFPYNRSSAQACRVLGDYGFESAVASGGELVTCQSNRYSLPRVGVPEAMGLFRFWTSGAYPGLPLRLLGRA